MARIDTIIHGNSSHFSVINFSVRLYRLKLIRMVGSSSDLCAEFIGINVTARCVDWKH